MRFALWPNLTQPWADALALARHADVTGWDGMGPTSPKSRVRTRSCSAACPSSPRGRPLLREATREQWGRMMARHLRRSQASSAILRRREPNLVDFVELLIVIAIYDLLMSRTLTGREIFIALAGQSGVRFGQHPTPEVPMRKFRMSDRVDHGVLPHFRSRSTPPHTPAVMLRPASQHSLITGQPWHNVTATARISARSDNHISPSISAHRVRRPRAARSRSAWVS
jgi:hypothetical protein